MPSPNPTVRRQHAGNALTTTLSAPIVSGADTTFTLTTATGWPDGSVGNFVVTINAGLSDVEKILCSTRTGTTVNVVTRGFDGTTAAGHATAATVAHTISALEIDEANQHTNATSGVHGAAGAVVGTTDAQVLTSKTLNLASNTLTGTTAQFNTALSDNDFATLAGSETLTNKTLTSPVANGATLDAASTHGGVSGTSLAADRAAWTAYTPTFGNVSTPAGTFKYKLIGKTLFLRLNFSAGSVTALGGITLSLPASLSTPTNSNSAVQVLVAAAVSTSATFGTLQAYVSDTGSVVNVYKSDGTGFGAGLSTATFSVQGVIEVA